MKTSSSRRGVGNAVWMALVAACAVGVGITGTLLWVQTRPVAPAPTPLPTAAAPVMPQQNPAMPPSTVGLTAGQAALTLANWNYDQERWEEATKQYQLALSGGQDNPDVRTDYGNALRFAGQPRKALEQYQIAQKQDSSHEQSLFNQGGLWTFALGDSKKGVEAWRAYLKRFPNGQSAPAARKFIVQHERDKGKGAR